MNVEKMSSNYLIIDSGTVITFDNQAALKFKIVLDTTFYFTLNIEFKTEDKDKRDIKLSADEKNNTINILCINFNNLLGTGTTVPIELATYKNKKILLHFWVYSLGEISLKKVDYCVYREE